MSRPMGGEFIPEHVPNGLDEFTQGYLAAMEFMLPDEDQDKRIRGFYKASLARAKEDCAQFQRENAADLAEFALCYTRKGPYSADESAGMAFFLARWGSGFREHGNLPVFARLDEAARPYDGNETPSVYRGLILFE